MSARSCASGMLFLVAASVGCRMVADGKNLEGVRLFQQGQPQAALQQFQQAIASQPQNADAYYNLAVVLHRQGKDAKDAQVLAQAESLYNQCLQLNREHTEGYRGLAVLLTETNRSDKAMTLLKNWVTTSPQNAEARVELARLYEEFGDRETAQLHLNQALLVDNYNHRAWAALGRLREVAGDYDQALANYQRSYSSNTFQPAVAERIAALSRVTTANGVVPSPLGSPRTVLTAPPIHR